MTAGPFAAARRGGLPGAVRAVASRPGFLLATVFLALVVLAAVAPGVLASQDPYATAPAQRLRPPSGTHLFGTDDIGRDLWSRVVHGSALTVAATGLALGIAVLAGLTIGVLAGFSGGVIDAAQMRAVDVLLAIPSLLMALSIVTALGFGTIPVAVAVGVGIVPGFARATRAEVLRVKSMPYVEAARAGGASWSRVLIRHVLPNSSGPVAALAVLDAGVAVLAIASLSFLGFGAPPPAAEWGTLISAGRNYLITAPWVALLPGCFVAAVVLSLNHVARTLQERTR